MSQVFPLNSNSVRLDIALVELGLARSRNQAANLIESGRVIVDGRVGRKASQPVTEDAKISILDAEDYVSRAGHKLAKALEAFGSIDLVGKTALDVGASTGGFTDVLLSQGASKGFALDVGHDQMVDELRQNSRVVCIYGFNARELSLDTLSSATGSAIGPDTIDLVVADLSFISLTLVLQQIQATAPNAEMVLLIKPQFEVGKQSLSASGIVTDHRLRTGAMKQVVEETNRLKLGIKGLVRSEFPGTHGNVEYVLWISPHEPLNQSKWTAEIEKLAKAG